MIRWRGSLEMRKSGCHLVATPPPCSSLHRREAYAAYTASARRGTIGWNVAMHERSSRSAAGAHVIGRAAMAHGYIIPCGPPRIMPGSCVARTMLCGNEEEHIICLPGLPCPSLVSLSRREPLAAG